MAAGSNGIMILLGTFNGARFLEEQLESIMAQTFSQWELLVRDDGSADHTPELLAKVEQKDRRVACLHDEDRHLGVVRNYGVLMEAALRRNADRVFFADQDDVWRPGKLASQLAMMNHVEEKHPAQTPILVYSDLHVVNERLESLHPSFMRFQRLAHEPLAPIRTLLSQNFVTGCATVINRPLLRLATPMPDFAVMHDWWVALCAAAFGVIAYMPDPLVLYRQHSRNEVGATGWWRNCNLCAERTRRMWGKRADIFQQTFRQAAALCDRGRERGLHSPYGALVRDYADCPTWGRAKRMLKMFKGGIDRQGSLRRLVFYSRLLLLNRTATSNRMEDV